MSAVEGGGGVYTAVCTRVELARRSDVFALARRIGVVKYRRGNGILPQCEIMNVIVTARIAKPS